MSSKVGKRSSGLTLRHRIRRLNFSTVRQFLVQNCAIPRKAARIGFVSPTYEKKLCNAAKNIRNSLGSNYKSAALPAELYSHCSI